MTSRKIGAVVLFAVAVTTLVLALNVLDVNAQTGGTTPRPAATPTTQAAPREVTITGKVVDLQGFMTGQFPSADHAKCTADCIKNGVPAGLETSGGLIVLGQGANGPSKALLPLAFQQVEVKGKLYEKGGTKYLDIASVRKAGGVEETDED